MCTFWKSLHGRRIYVGVGDYSWGSTDNLLFQLIEHAEAESSKKSEVNALVAFSSNLAVYIHGR